MLSRFRKTEPADVNAKTFIKQLSAMGISPQSAQYRLERQLEDYIEGEQEEYAKVVRSKKTKEEAEEKLAEARKHFDDIYRPLLAKYDHHTIYESAWMLVYGHSEEHHHQRLHRNLLDPQFNEVLELMLSRFVEWGYFENIEDASYLIHGADEQYLKTAFAADLDLIVHLAKALEPYCFEENCFVDNVRWAFADYLATQKEKTSADVIPIFRST